MAGDIKLDRAKIQAGGRKVLLSQILYSSKLFYPAGNRRAVIRGDIKLFDGERILDCKVT